MSRLSSSAFRSRLGVAIASVIVTTVVVAGGLAMAAPPPGTPAAPGQELWARVGTPDNGVSGILVEDRGAVSVDTLTFPGYPAPVFVVTFDRSIANCGWTASINDVGWFGPPSGWGVALVANDADLQSNQLRVRLFEQNGTPVTLGDPDTFTVVAHC